MMAPDYAHWHGTYDLAKHFYTKYIPELEKLIHKGHKSGDAKKIAAAKDLQTLLDKTLNSSDHMWYLNKMTDAQKAVRKAALDANRADAQSKKLVK
jgi:hypothetical protein